MDKNKKEKEQFRQSNSFSLEERHAIIAEFLSGKHSRPDIWEKHTGSRYDHGEILRWMRLLDYEIPFQYRIRKFAFRNINMEDKKADMESDSFELLQLKKRIAELEQQLKDAEMKAIAFSTMVDIAEKEFKIPIRKKFNTKPSQK
jgi:transposase